MNDADWETARHIIAETLLRPSHERDRFLTESCTDPALRAEIAALLDVQTADSSIGGEHGSSSPAAAADDTERTLLQAVRAAIPVAPIRSLDATRLIESVLAKGDTLGARNVRRPFSGTSRFTVQRVLGSGAFGTVYQAWDREQQAPVAIKVLHADKPELLFRFKREFRALIDVRHRNLVRLYELFADTDHWFLTMELVEGETFLRYVRRGEACDLGRLRSALRQLTEGIQALHAAHRLHRDLKPDNALVAADGRVVILDFSLVHEFDELMPHASRTQPAGTPGYIAPEVLNGSVSEASDWYAVGVMLFEALTGALPHPRSLRQLWTPDVQGAEPDPRGLAPDSPAELSDLCRQLLKREPQERAGGAAILSALGTSDSAPSGGSVAAEHRGEPEVFVGRAEPLRDLEAAFGDTQEGHLNVVALSGPSGIGKTALVKRFLFSLTQRYQRVIVLRGCCYEFESVPYKGLDALVDALGRHLQRLPAERVEAILPREAFLLPKLFPVLGRVTAIATAPARSAIVPDMQELRQRAFRALRELLARFSDRQPIVIWIDDLQWGDRDSSTFLADLCAPPDQPPLLLILTYRSEELTSSAALAHLHQLLANQRLLERWHDLRLTELSADESLRLLGDLLPADVENARAAATIMHEAGGHPLFLQQLARFVNVPGGSAEMASGRTITLRSVLQERIRELSPFARDVLEFVCIATQPLTPAILLTAADSGSAEERAEALAILVREKFARSSSTGAGGGRRIEPYHDQVRTAVVEFLPPERRRARHARLAAVLALHPDTERQALVGHYQEAGDLPAAFEAALKAAHLAAEQLAFDRAAMFYQAALNAGEFRAAEQVALYRKLADTLGLAGRGRDSAVAYLKAAEHASPADRFDLRRLAAEQLMRSGYIDDALALLEQLVDTVGIKMIRTPGEAVRGIVGARLQTRLKFLTGSPGPRSGQAHPSDLARLDLLRTAGLILNIADPVLATYYQTRHILASLKIREPVHLSMALGVEASIRVAGGRGNASAAIGLLKRSRHIAEQTGNPNVLGMHHLLRCYVDYLLCRIPDGLEHTREAITFLREHCKGVAWEITGAYVLRFWFLGWHGAFKEVGEQLPQLLQEGISHSDVNMEVSLRLLTYAQYFRCSIDQPNECISDCTRALERWSKRGYHLQHYGAMFNIVESYLYLGDYASAKARFDADWDRMSTSFILRWQTLQIMTWFLKGRIALACWLERPTDAVLRHEIETCIRRMGRIRSHWTGPMKHVLEGGVAVGDGRIDVAVEHLRQAAEGFEEASLEGYAAAARHYCGILQGGDEGKGRVRMAASFMTSQGVIKPAALFRMLLPGRWGSMISLEGDDTRERVLSPWSAAKLPCG